MTDQPVSVTLNRAADLIEQRGWNGNDTYDGRADEGSFGWNAGDDRPLCLEGGIMAAAGITTDSFWPEKLNTCPAYRAVQAYLETTNELWWFNDADNRTAAEVIEVLRAAAVIAESRETTPQPAQPEAVTAK